MRATRRVAPTTRKPPFSRGLRLVEVTGFEPVASSVRGKRSAGLSYTPGQGSSLTPGLICGTVQPVGQITSQSLLDDGGG